jgi:hypothetical protein
MYILHLTDLFCCLVCAAAAAAGPALFSTVNISKMQYINTMVTAGQGEKQKRSEGNCMRLLFSDMMMAIPSQAASTLY